MPLLPEFPISGDDYTVGTITTTAGKKEFVTKDAYLNSFGAVRPGDHIYISTTGKILVIGSITGENSGTFTDACPDDCAVKDLPLRVVYKTASSRVQGRIAMLLEKLSKGFLAALSDITAKEGQIFQATNVAGELKAIDLNADNVAETEKRKFMPADFNADSIAETDAHKIMTADERNKIASIIGLALNDWTAGTSSTEALISPQKLAETIKNSFGGALDNGWVKLSNGLLIQWGLKQSENSSYGQIFYPTTFTQKCFFYPVLLQAWTSEGFAPIVYGDWGDNLNLFSHGFHCRQMNGTSGVTGLNTWNVAWLAIGY